MFSLTVWAARLVERFGMVLRMGKMFILLFFARSSTFFEDDNLRIHYVYNFALVTLYTNNAFVFVQDDIFFYPAPPYV